MSKRPFDKIQAKARLVYSKLPDGVKIYKLSGTLDGKVNAELERKAMAEDRQYYCGHPDGGLVDVDGVEWFKTDGYSGWYRWEDQLGGRKLISLERPEFPHD
jgi:hypothetical protein